MLAAAASEHINLIQQILINQPVLNSNICKKLKIESSISQLHSLFSNWIFDESINYYSPEKILLEKLVFPHN